MTAGRQPFLHDQVVLVSAPTMAICPPSGQLDGTGAGGLYTADRRVLSVLRVQVGGAEPEPIHDELVGANGARFVAVLRGVEAPTPDVVLRLERRRVIDDTAAGQVLTETLMFANAGVAPVDVTATIRLGCDFADVASVKDGAATPVPVTTTATADGFEVISAAVPGWSVAVHATPAPSDTVTAADGSVDLGFPLQIPGGGAASIVLTVVPLAPVDARVVDPPGRRDVVGRDDPADAAPTVSSRDGVLGPLLARSIDDLDRLVLSDPVDPQDEFYAAGAPWYLTMFGRDSLSGRMARAAARGGAGRLHTSGARTSAGHRARPVHRRGARQDPARTPSAGARSRHRAAAAARCTTARSTRHRCGSGCCTGPGGGGCPKPRYVSCCRTSSPPSAGCSTTPTPTATGCWSTSTSPVTGWRTRAGRTRRTPSSTSTGRWRRRRSRSARCRATPTRRRSPRSSCYEAFDVADPVHDVAGISALGRPAGRRVPRTLLGERRHRLVRGDRSRRRASNRSPRSRPTRGTCSPPDC